jgi:hypothetical protein
MVYLKRLWSWVCTPYRAWIEHREYKKKLKELEEKDPFIYK